MQLIIVESPTKAKTIAKFLDSSYKIESSFGHIRDLPKSKIGVDIENGFKPQYVIPTSAKKNVNNLKKLVAKATQIILASDEDREGEAIAWHLEEALNVPKDKLQRIVFHEITPEAIKNALKNPRDIDLKLVDAQQTRRILDRLVGYELSPFLWKKVAKGLSAGRVQSVATKLIVEREKEIKSFQAEEYWTIDGEFETKHQEKLIARLNKVEGENIDKLKIKDEKSAEDLKEKIKGQSYAVSFVQKKEGQKSASAPFTTSSLQQTANRFLGFSAKQTMTVAQKLYELGLITYMRTDSLNLSTKFIAEAEAYLKTKLGQEYSTPKQFKTKSKNAQEAHEAIRPTNVSSEPGKIKELDKGQEKLYALIWQRALASQMANARLDLTTIDIEDENKKYQFHASGQVVKFLGYLKIYPEKSKELDLPAVENKEELKLLEIINQQHFTEAPARYSDAGLVKIMEKYGIGRPSTYAPTIATIIARNYVQRDDHKRLEPTPIAFVVIDLLQAHFPEIVDYKFTAQMEDDLDNIANGQKEWRPVLSDFYTPFHANLVNKYDEVKKSDIIPEEKTEEICDKCGAPMIVKTGRFGKFLACSGFPACHNIKSIGGDKGNKADKRIEELKEKFAEEKCSKCGEPMIVKNGRFGPFLGCSAYPKCKNIKNIKTENTDADIICPVCKEGKIIKKMSRKGPFYACDRYPDCKTAFWQKPLNEKCPDCDSLLLEDKNGKKVCSQKCGFEE
jgi:DNA topoisomerase-1